MNKKYFLGLLGLLAIGIVSAGYIVSEFILTVDVFASEPLEVKYAVIDYSGDDLSYTCEDIEDDSILWESGDGIDIGGLYAGEKKIVCAKVNNLGDGNVPYEMNLGILNNSGNYEKCIESFGENRTLATGVLTQYTQVHKTGGIIEVSADAPPVDDCKLQVYISRG